MEGGLGRWAGTTPDQAARLLAGLQAPWWIGGGWAIDLAAGRTTRAHGDIDIALPRRDQPAFAAALKGWDIQVASGGRLTPWTPGDWLEGGRRHQFWARPDPSSPWTLEILLEETDGPEWTYRRDARVRRPLSKIGRRTTDGTPYLAPEIALLFKASQPELDRNAADFEVALPLLDGAARVWLAQALDMAHPGSPWRERL